MSEGEYRQELEAMARARGTDTNGRLRPRFTPGESVVVTLNFAGPHTVVVAEPDEDGDIVLLDPNGRYGLCSQVHCRAVQR